VYKYLGVKEGAMIANEEVLKVPYRMEIQFEMSYGRISKFFKELRDNGKILGTKCQKCGVTYCPPSSDCPKCWVPTDWVEVGQQGTLLAYTVIGMPALWLKVEVPYPMGLIKLDGADTGLLHFLGEIELNKIKVGMRVEAVLKKKEERGGYITDIAWFKPI
jgi:uncharacterized OB-fold protein